MLLAKEGENMLCVCECVCEERRDVFERREWQRREERGHEKWRKRVCCEEAPNRRDVIMCAVWLYY